MRSLPAVVTAILLVASPVSITAHASSFFPLGHLPGAAPLSGASAISADGSTIVGYARATSRLDGPREAVRWDSTALQIESLRQTVVDDGFGRAPTDVSANGDVITLNVSQRLATDIQTRPFRWNEVDGFQEVPLAANHIDAYAAAVSADGAVVVGGSRQNIVPIAFRWSTQSGMQLLGTLATDPRQSPTSFATDVSSDGRIVVGESSIGLSTEAFRWTEETGLVGLGYLPGGTYSKATGISLDGTTIVGNSTSEANPGSTQAFRWTSETGMIGLGYLHSSEYRVSGVWSTSADGRLVFGYSVGSSSSISGALTIDQRMFVWSARDGMRDFTDVLKHDFHLTDALTGWSQLTPTGISNDSLTIVGNGINPDGNGEAWIVRLDRPIGVPEPSSLAIALSIGFFYYIKAHKRPVDVSGTAPRAAKSSRSISKTSACSALAPENR